MKLFIFFILIPFQAKAINQTFLQMPLNRAYMSFVLTKYLAWHRMNFDFPKKSKFIDELASRIDHWQLPKMTERQILMSHGLNTKGELTQRLRLFVHPELRSRPELRGKGLPPGKEIWFTEWENQGEVCHLFKNAASFSVWCQGTGEKSFQYSHEEDSLGEIPENWMLPFPRLGTKVIRKLSANKVKEIIFYPVSAHPSRIPKGLLRSVNLHTIDALFPLDHVSSDREGKITVYYP